jgi:6-phosphogluconolactonase
MKTSVLLFSMLSLAATIQAQQSGQTMFNLLIGTYSSPDMNGIHVYTFNSETAAFSKKAEVGGISNPSYLAVSADNKNVYAVNEVGKGQGSVSAFSFEPSSGKLTLLNHASSGGDGPCYITVDDKKRLVFVGNYSGGSLAAVPLNKDGSFQENIQAITHSGSSVLKNQDKPHVHATVLSPDGKFLFVPDLGTDKVNIYRVDYSGSKALVPANPGFVDVKAGSGPRHFTFDSEGTFAYLIQEMTGVVTAFSYADGKLQAKQSIGLAPSGFSGRIDAADIHLSPDGNFLYGSLRGDINEIVILRVDKKGGLTYAGRQSTLGKTPRNFAIDPTGKFLLVANQNSGDIIVFRRDQKSGLLTDTGKKITVDKPVCLKFTVAN